MERLLGMELRQAMAEGKGRLAPARAIQIAAQVLSALEEVHAAGVVHRDLKPENIFLVHAMGQQDFVKVLDFGIAQMPAQSDPRLTEIGRTVGTPHYMSPEQVLGTRVDGRSDLYAVAVLLYACLAGELPLTGRTPGEIMIAQVQSLPIPLHERAPALPRQLCDVVMRGLHKRANDRHPSAEAMRQALLNAAIGLQERDRESQLSASTGMAEDKTLADAYVPQMRAVVGVAVRRMG